jgi:hypothetical protein
MTHPRHRGRRSGDTALFGPQAVARLRTAAGELAWLLERGYGQTAACKLVGDHHQLRARQRLAVLRCASTGRDREARQVPLAQVRGREVVVDGFNCLITLETALSGGLLLRGRDGTLRDLAGVHGRYHSVSETEPAVRALGEVLAAEGPAGVRILLDRPVSSSGRLRALILDLAARAGWRFEVVLTNSPDRELIAAAGAIVATSDAVVLDGCVAFTPLVEAAVARAAPGAWIVDLG